MTIDKRKGPVTRDEIQAVLDDRSADFGWDERAERIAALVAERTAQAVEEARRKEREACAQVVEEARRKEREACAQVVDGYGCRSMARRVRQHRCDHPRPRVLPRARGDSAGGGKLPWLNGPEPPCTQEAIDAHSGQDSGEEGAAVGPPVAAQDAPSTAGSGRRPSPSVWCECGRVARCARCGQVHDACVRGLSRTLRSGVVDQLCMECAADEFPEAKDSARAAGASPGDSEDEIVSCDECGHPAAPGNVVYRDSGARPLCSLCNTGEGEAEHGPVPPRAATSPSPASAQAAAPAWALGLDEARVEIGRLRSSYAKWCEKWNAREAKVQALVEAAASLRSWVDALPSHARTCDGSCGDPLCPWVVVARYAESVGAALADLATLDAMEVKP